MYYDVTCLSWNSPRLMTLQHNTNKAAEYVFVVNNSRDTSFYHCKQAIEPGNSVPRNILFG